jgi:hypothetical protein
MTPPKMKKMEDDLQKNGKRPKKLEKMENDKKNLKITPRGPGGGGPNFIFSPEFLLFLGGKIKQTIEERRNKACGIVAEIQTILENIPLGKYKMDIGLKLRQAMLLKGVLFNSEAWHGASLEDIKTLESIDEQLLRSFVKAHSKTPLEFLYLETGAIPVRFLIYSRRMVYLHSILRRGDEELVKRVYRAQTDNPSPGDIAELLKEDFNTIEEHLKKQQYIMSVKRCIKSSSSLK